MAASTVAVPAAAADDQPMRLAHWVVIALAVVLMGFDGFDVLSISFASPGISKEWGVAFAGLGWILSLELFGMAVGALAWGALADRIGRRPTLLSCLLVMTFGMIGAAHSEGIAMLAVARVVTGLGIGGVLVCANSIAAEFADARRRTLCIALAGAGYPLGAALGGFAASAMLASGGWRHIFNLGALLTLLVWPLVYWLVPESPGWRPRGETAGDPAAVAAQGEAPAWTRTLAWATVLVTAIYFFHVFSFYFLLKWIPRIMTLEGASSAQAARVLTWATLGGVGGGVTLGLLAGRGRPFVLTAVLLVVSAASVIAFGATAQTGQGLFIACLLGGFACNGAILGIYALIAATFPQSLRGTGTGIAIGIGRLGAVAAPVVAGYLLQGGLGVPAVAAWMACGSIAATFALFALKQLTSLETAA